MWFQHPTEDLAKYINSVSALDLDEEGIELSSKFINNIHKLSGYKKALIKDIYSIGCCEVFPHIKSLFSLDIDESMKKLGYTNWNEQTLTVLTSLPRLQKNDIEIWQTFDQHYLEINANLRSQRKSNYEQIISNFRNLLKPIYIETPILIYRGLSFDPHWFENEVIMTDSFWHTSLEPEVAKKFCQDVKCGFGNAKSTTESSFLTLTISGNIKLLWIKLFSYLEEGKAKSIVGGINEVILCDGISFKVSKIEKKDITYYDLECIAN